MAAAVLQLGFAAAGAIDLDFDHANPAIARYAALSGTDSGYGFFAPTVGTQLRVTFELTDAAGTKSSDILTTGASHEADLRIGDLVAMFWMVDADLQRALVTSWAGRILARHPEAEKIVVRIDAYDLPSMAYYREGIRPAWSPYYDAEITRRTKLERGPAAGTGGAP